jgi:hypothetical protein
MQAEIIALLIIPMAAVSISRVIQLWKQKILPHTYHEVELKPIDCAFCLSFWINACYYHEGTVFAMVLIWIASMIVASFIDLRL